MLIRCRDRLFKAVKEIAPEGVNCRKKNLQVIRGEYIVEGPNRVWSVDGYCKLEPFGIEIYAAIDAYSRYVIWIYCGITGRTAVSVCRQYLDEIEDSGILPVIIRSDRGVETVMAAEAHFRLRNQASIAPVSFKDAWRFGKSTKNVRIESWWNQMSKAQIGSWRVNSA
jgi:transposase InsO family protein